MGDLTGKDGTILRTPQEIVGAFQKHHVMANDSMPTDRHLQATSPMIVASPTRYTRASEEMMEAVRRVLAKTSSSSSPGPDRVNYRLLKLINGTPLSVAVINDIAGTCEGGGGSPETWRDLKMVMIPKPGKPIDLVKSWRPIVLTNAVGKLCEQTGPEGDGGQAAT